MTRRAPRCVLEPLRLHKHLLGGLCSLFNETLQRPHKCSQRGTMSIMFSVPPSLPSHTSSSLQRLITIMGQRYDYYSPPPPQLQTPNSKDAEMCLLSHLEEFQTAAKVWVCVSVCVEGGGVRFCCLKDACFCSDWIA